MPGRASSGTETVLATGEACVDTSFVSASEEDPGVVLTVQEDTEDTEEAISTRFSEVASTQVLLEHGFRPVEYEVARATMYGKDRKNVNSGLYVNPDGTIGAIRAIVGCTKGCFEEDFAQTLGKRVIVYNLPCWKKDGADAFDLTLGQLIDFLVAYVPSYRCCRSQWQTFYLGKVRLMKVRTVKNRHRNVTKLTLVRT